MSEPSASPSGDPLELLAALRVRFPEVAAEVAAMTDEEAEAEFRRLSAQERQPNRAERRRALKRRNGRSS